jgi:transcription antitermination factor NusG
VQIRSNFESCVAKEFQAKGFESYCPVFQELHRWADRKKMIDRPVFPGYVFVRIEATPQTSLSILQSKGVVRVLGTGGHPEPIPDSEIQPIRRMLEQGSQVMGYPFLQKGARVRVRRGALKGVEGVLVRMKNQARLVLSVSLLSQSIAAEVDVQNVEVIHSRRSPGSRQAA